MQSRSPCPSPTSTGSLPGWDASMALGPIMAKAALAAAPLSPAKILRRACAAAIAEDEGAVPSQSWGVGRPCLGPHADASTISRAQNNPLCEVGDDRSDGARNRGRDFTLDDWEDRSRYEAISVSDWMAIPSTISTRHCANFAVSDGERDLPRAFLVLTRRKARQMASPLIA